MKPIALLQLLKTELAEVLHTTVKAHPATQEDEYPHLSIDIQLGTEKEADNLHVFLYPINKTAFEYNDLLEFQYIFHDQVIANMHEDLRAFIGLLNGVLPLGAICKQNEKLMLRYVLPIPHQHEPDIKAIAESIVCLAGLVQMYEPIIFALSKKEIGLSEASYIGNLI